MRIAAKIIFFALILVLGGIIFIPTVRAAYITLIVSESSRNVMVDQEVYGTVRLNPGPEMYPSGCKIFFGDSEEISSFCENLEPERVCTRNFWHSYSNPGTYTIKATCGYYSTMTSTGGIIKDEVIITVIEKLDPNPVEDDINPLASTTLSGITYSITNLIFGIISGLAILLIVIGGFLILVSAGSPEQVNKGRKIIQYTIIGIIIMALAAGIRALIYEILGINF